MSVVQRVIDENAAREAEQPYLKAWKERPGKPVITPLPLARTRLVVGRLPECDLDLGNDAQASRHHATLEATLDAWYVTDARSTNGTLLNQVALEAATRLKDGDDLCFGKSCFTYHDPRPVAAGDITVRPSRFDARLTGAQRRTVVELCRPLYRDRDAQPPSNSVIAAALGVEEHTIKKNLNQVFPKVGLAACASGEKRRRLALLALDDGLIRGHELRPR